ncbi:phage tail tape measure protein [Desulfosporosinus sp.]|uniref:phage tail tape measure protein n=1 Tax=Desulfosporosinus sp. TaxID=157907 RepID=UPI0025C26805|nr:phage tail tape measure protein [Desulfosporosinus sp.]MBC2722036.1 phage tail tape measure protein [Desulfosporosinus sp.]MBC2728019.1 phage tail tape measure protein [Desulfosporosinus sp.]
MIKIAATIKGISVLIEGETTGLTRALADVNRSSRGIQGELRQVERLLRFDPTNTELLTQRQTLLGNAVANAREKLDRLRAAQEQVNEQLARGDIGQDEYRAFQREIAATEQQLRRFEEQVASASSEINELGDTAESNANKLSDVGEKVKGIGETMAVVITAPVMAAGAVMLKGAVDAENAQNKLQGQLGITAEEAENLGDTAEDVWKNGFGENIEEVNNAIKDVRLTMGALADEELQNIAEGAMTIADLFDQDIKEVTAAAGVAMKAFGINGQEAMDLITVGFQKGGDYSGELIDTLREYSPQFASMGMAADQMMGILISGAQAGAWNMDKVGDAVKEFNIRAQDGSKTTAEGFSAIGLSAKEMGSSISAGGEKGQQAFMATIAGLAAMRDPVEQNIAGVALFGTQWEDVRAKVIVAMADGMKGLGEFKGATENASKAAYETNPARALTESLREMQAAIGPALLPLADIMTNTVAPAIKSMAEWFSELSPAGQKTVPAIIGITAAIGPLMIVLGPLIPLVGGVAGALGAVSAAATGGAAGVGILTTAFPALGTALTALTGPVGIAVAGVAAVVAIGGSLVSSLNEEVIPTVDLFGDEVSDSTKKAVESYLDMDKKLSTSLMSFKANNTTITQGMAAEMVGTFEKMGADIKAGRDKHYEEDLANLTKFYADQGLLDSQEAQNALDKMKQAHGAKNNELTSFQARIKEIYEKAAADHRSITQEEADQIKKIKDEMEQLAIEALTNSEAEQKAILTRMQLQAKDITTLQAADVIANSAKQRDETTHLANEQYEKVVASITRQRNEGVITSDDQAKKMIQAAERTREASITKARDMHEKVVYELQQQNKDVAEQINEQDGTIKTGWDKLKEWFTNNPIIRWIITKTSGSSGSDDKVDNNYNGTNYFPGGLTTLHEKGYEIYNLPRGTKIYNHEASEDLVLKTAQEVARGVLAGNQDKPSGITQYIAIESPTPLSPSETARQVKNASRRLALEW